MLVVAVPTDPQMDAFSLLMVAGAVYTLVVLARRGRSFWTNPLRGDDRQLAVQVAFFLLTPPTVLLHELAHALTTVAVGGTVVQFHYVGFSGYVRPAGFFAVEDVWLLAVSGSIASLLAAVSFLLVGGYVRVLPVTARYVLVMGGGLQAAFTLGGYPLWSILGRFGDWMAIYDFEATPGLSAITLGAHALTIAVVVVWWRRSLKPRLSAWEGGAAGGQDSPAAVATGGAPDAAARVTNAAHAARVALVLLQEGDYLRAEALALRWLSNRSDSVRNHSDGVTSHSDGASDRSDGASSRSDGASDRSDHSHSASADSHNASTRSQSDRSNDATIHSNSVSNHSDSASKHSDSGSNHSNRASSHSDSASGGSNDESDDSDSASRHSDSASGHSDGLSDRSDDANECSRGASTDSHGSSGYSHRVSDRSVSGVLLFVLGAAQLPRMKYGKAAEYLEQAAATTDDEALRQRALANLMLAHTQDHRAGEALAVYERLRPEWRTNPGVQKALDVIQVRTGKRPPAV